MSWQPIETAPKDGTEFIAYCEDGDYWFIRWYPSKQEKRKHPRFKKFWEKGGWAAGKDVGEIVFVPCLTHWMPLPPPPEPST